MRTTIAIDDELLRLAKRRAQERRTTLGRVVEDALRAALSQADEKPKTSFKLVTFRGDGPHDGVDLDRTSALIAAEDVARYRRKR